jgi:hypothetical protein
MSRPRFARSFKPVPNFAKHSKLERSDRVRCTPESADNSKQQLASRRLCTLSMALDAASTSADVHSTME